MRLSWRRRLSVYAGLGAIAIALLSVVGAGPASADQTISHTFPGVACTAKLGSQTLNQTQDITVGFIVPDSVTPGQSFTVTFPGGSALLPSTSNGFAIKAYKNLSETFQINGTTFTAGSINNPGTATIVPTAPPSTPATIAESASLTAPNHFASGNPGPFAPGTLTTPTITVNAVAPASGDVTLNAFQLTTTATLNIGPGVDAAVTCAIPQTILVTIPVVSGATTTTSTTMGGSDTTVGPTTTTSTTIGNPTTTTTGVATTTTTGVATTTTTGVATTTTTGVNPTTTTTGGATTTTAAGPTTTVPTVVTQGTAHGSGTNVNTCSTHLTPEVAPGVPLIPDSNTTVTVTISTDASPAPHLGDPITLSNSKVTVVVPGSLLLLGYTAKVLNNGSVIPSTLNLSIAGSNTTEGTHTFAPLHSSPKITVHDPDGVPYSGDETIAPLTTTLALPNTVWHPTSKTANVLFTEKSAVIAATLAVDGATYTDTVTCSVKNPNSFVAVGATGSVTTTTNAAVVAPEAVTTTTVAAAAANTLPFTGANVAFWLIVAVVLMDAGAVLILGTKRQVTNLLKMRRQI